MGERVVGLVETGRVPKLRRIADDGTGFTKFTLEHTEGLPAVLLLWAGPGEQADHAWLALELVAMAFAPPGEVFTWQAEREPILDAEYAKRVMPDGYVESGERVDPLTTARTASCPHCGGALIMPAPFRRVAEEEFVELTCDPDDYPLA